MLLKPVWKRQVKLKMVVLAPLLAHLGTLGRHLGFNLVHLGAKLGAKRFLTGLSQKSFLKVFVGMASRTLPKIFQETGGFFLGGFYKHFCIGGVPHQTQKSDPKVLPSCLQDGAK